MHKYTGSIWEIVSLSPRHWTHYSIFMGWDLLRSLALQNECCSSCMPKEQKELFS